MLDAVSRDEWITSFARAAGVQPPSVDEITELLDLAATAAHASERTAAPLACWVAGRSGLELAELRQIAQRVGERSIEPSSASPPGGRSRG
jgi:Domain of unknown function (DUF6457)